MSPISQRIVFIKIWVLATVFVFMNSLPVNELVNKALLNISDETPCNDIFQFQFSIQFAA